MSCFSTAYPGACLFIQVDKALSFNWGVYPFNVNTDMSGFKSTTWVFTFFLSHLFFFLFPLFLRSYGMNVFNDSVFSPLLAYYLCCFLIIGYEHLF